MIIEFRDDEGKVSSVESSQITALSICETVRKAGWWSVNVIHNKGIHSTCYFRSAVRAQIEYDRVMGLWEGEEYKEEAKEDREPTDEEYRKLARRDYEQPSDGNLEIAADAIISRTTRTSGAYGMRGAFVQAWVWVCNADIEEARS